ncbi:VID27 cytoplasmic protein [Coprinopsis marcescibilis]|uniref:VID27 cytoplasmic protein n=1 Tax=Coprinopsis marcescibilis TaxID=230819 RepID=A0A5C3KTT6_COPMA|nr:VID27 cytoplasmic protein [Coprinopsis marcescibilis]
MGKVWHDPNAAEVVKISSGQFYLTRAEILRTNRECIYNEAMATIRRLPSVEHNFELVVTRVYEDEDQELLEDEDETDEERVFLISEELEFRAGETDGEPTFIWRDLHGDVDEMFEFVATGTNAPTRAFFETCMYRAMYERKYKRSADATMDGDLEQFVYKAPKSTPKPRRKVDNSNPKPKTPSNQASTEVEVIDVDQPSTSSHSNVPTGPPAPEEGRLGPPRNMPNLEPLLTVEAEIYRWNFDSEEFDNDGIVHAQIAQQRDDKFAHWIVAATDEGTLLAHEICPEMNQRLSRRMKTITWNRMSDAGRGHSSSWLFKFASQEDYSDFVTLFTRVQWEGLHHLPFNKLKQDDQDYVMSSITDEDVEMRDVQDDSDEEEEIASQLDPEEEPSEDEEEDEEVPSEEDEDEPKPVKGERNSQLTVGYNGDRSYVVRGSNIGVFSHNNRNSVKYYATISKVTTPKGKEFRPKNVMLHDQDTKMILMNTDNPNSLYSLDIERGKVVEEWKVHDNISVNNIAPDSKFAPTTREQTLVGTSHNALFRIDPRVSGSKLVDSQYKQYVSKNKFSGVVTTKNGKLAVASEKGDIRLFDSIGKNAKTALPPLGDPILGIDVTANGRYIVATTKTYLLLIDTLIGEGKDSGQLGFDKSFPAKAKPQPKQLRLKSEHVAYMGGVINLTPARFNQGTDQEENAIVTSTGPYVIAWDFNKVKKGALDKYDIKKYEDHVVQDNFKFGDDKEIIVALDNNVLAINKKNLKKPTRQSLAGNFGYSRSSIVNAPY